MAQQAFPFSAIVGQEEMKLAILVAAVDPTVGGVLVFGDRGTGKSTAVRALAALLPPIRAVVGCPYACDAAATAGLCAACTGGAKRGAPKTALIPVPVVDLPLGATEDRVVGALDLERALTRGEKAFEPGLLARANRGFLYIDEVNLLEDHLVDLLIDVAASGENVVEREGLSRAPSRALRARRQRQPGGGRTAPAAARPLRARGRREDADDARRPRRGREASRRLRPRPGRVREGLEGRGRAHPPPHRQGARAAGRREGPGPHARSRRDALHEARHRRPARANSR